MSHSISPQHPAVVLRSHYVQLRALLAVAMIAVVCLTAAVVILAAGDGDSTQPALAEPPATPVTTPLDQRYDGGPDEGTRGPRSSGEDTARHAPQIRYDGGPDEGTRGPGR